MLSEAEARQQTSTRCGPATLIVKDGLKRAAKTINNIKGAWINDIKVVTDDAGKVAEWRVNMRVNFVLD